MVSNQSNYFIFKCIFMLCNKKEKNLRQNKFNFQQRTSHKQETLGTRGRLGVSHRQKTKEAARRGKTGGCVKITFLLNLKERGFLTTRSAGGVSTLLHILSFSFFFPLSLPSPLSLSLSLISLSLSCLFPISEQVKQFHLNRIWAQVTPFWFDLLGSNEGTQSKLYTYMHCKGWKLSCKHA